MFLKNNIDLDKKIEALIVLIKSTSSQSTTLSLYEDVNTLFKHIFDSCSTSSISITSNQDIFALCIECLSLFMKHKVTKEDMTSDEDDIEIVLNDSFIEHIIDSFLPSLIRIEDILRVKGAKVNSITMTMFKMLNKKGYIPSFFSLFQNLFASLQDIHYILETCQNIAYSEEDSIKNSLLSLLRPHILPWMKKYPDKKFFFLWINIMKNITNDKDNYNAHKARSARLWPSQAIEVFDGIKDGLLDRWFEMIKKNEEEQELDSPGAILYSNFISMLSSVPSLVHHLSPKYDTNMEWCKKKGCFDEDYSRYLGNCYPSLQKWIEIIESIKKCPDSDSSSKIYHKYREDILSVFLASQSKSEIEEHKREIVLCVQCLSFFLCNEYSENASNLPIPDLNDLIDTFIDHLSRVEDVLKGVVDGDYCFICLHYYYSTCCVRTKSFLDMISQTFQRILERGSKEKIGEDVSQYIPNTLLIMSYPPYDTSSIRLSIFTLIKPYIKEWLRKYYKDSESYGQWMYILSLITLSRDNFSPEKSICAEIWPLFRPVLDVVKREFVGDKIVDDNHEEILRFFSNLCCVQSNIVEIYDNVKDVLDSWFEAIKLKVHKKGIKYWSKLISMFSSVPSLVSQISPKFDNHMKWCHMIEDCRVSFDKFISNSCSFVSSSYLSTNLHSIPILSLIPSIETSLCPEKEGYSYISHVRSVMKLDISVTGKSILIQYVLKRNGSSSQDIITHSSLIQYTPPQHMLVKMPFVQERSLKQSVYDLIERTGGGVEVMFEQGSLCCSFEEYEQEA
ncbi:hypothetical protein ADUPG1_009648 [Aduncisulcus paluster]|uniref:Uncharacterized protein n=1 Tax=Aduncisulcus paluster TaxID=2918883 RepID=A0ABQ5KXI9_9EUKA|nr:hypothetical protein ADUPG1_009648 [Aduncisulcus paluster]